MIWTLAWNGTEKELRTWRVTADFSRQTANKDKSFVRLRTVEAFDGPPPQWTPFKTWLLANPNGDPTTQVAIIYRDRTSVGVGGSIYAQGFFDDPTRINDGGKEYIEYQIYNLLELFKRNPFKQYRKQFAGFSNPVDASSPKVFVDVICPEIFIGDNWATGGLFKQNEQFAEIINWVNECYNPTRRGAMAGMLPAKDVVQTGAINPVARIPKYRANTISCMEAMNIVSRWLPDVFYKVDESVTPPRLSVLTVGRWDYATDPPTFLDYTNLPEVIVNITTEQEKEIRLQGTSARKYAGVIIYYRITSTTDGKAMPVIYRDAYVPGIDVSFTILTGGHTAADFHPEVPSHFVELEGDKTTNVKADITIEPQPIADVVSGAAATRAAWWLAHDKTMQSDKVDPDSIVAEVAEVVDDAGNPIDLSLYPNVLAHDSQIPKWMKTELGIRVIRAHVKAGLAFDKFHDEDWNILDHKVSDRQARKTVKITNASTKTYTAVKSFESGETVPRGVAESVFRGAAIDQWAGSLTFTKDQLRSDIYIGCRLKLVGPTTTFTNVIPQLVNEKPHYGETQVQYGPTAPPDAEGLIELSRATRLRVVYNMPSGRDDGSWGGGSATEVDDSAESPDFDTAHLVGGETAAYQFKDRD